MIKKKKKFPFEFVDLVHLILTAECPTYTRASDKTIKELRHTGVAHLEPNKGRHASDKPAASC